MTRGYIPRMETYLGMEVPPPLEVEICRGEASIEQVLSDVMGVTKLNYNIGIPACSSGSIENPPSRKGRRVFVGPRIQSLR